MISDDIDRFQLKLNTKAKEAFEQINRTTQERLENDQIQVNFIRINELLIEII